MGKMPVFGPILNYFNYVNLYNHKGLAMFGKKSGSVKKASFDPKTEIWP